MKEIKHFIYAILLNAVFSTMCILIEGYIPSAYENAILTLLIFHMLRNEEKEKFKIEVIKYILEELKKVKIQTY